MGRKRYTPEDIIGHYYGWVSRVNRVKRKKAQRASSTRSACRGRRDSSTARLIDLRIAVGGVNEEGL